jgi:hypothetical protein
MKKQRTAEEMQQVLLDFDASGQSVREYCEKAGIAEHLLRYCNRPANYILSVTE